MLTYNIDTEGGCFYICRVKINGEEKLKFTSDSRIEAVEIANYIIDHAENMGWWGVCKICGNGKSTCKCLEIK